MGLKVWLPLDGDLKNLGYSGIGVTNNGATIDEAGKIGNCYYFDGSARYLELSESVGNLYSGDFSWAVWLKPTDSTRGIISSEYGSTGSGQVSFEIQTYRRIRIWWNGSPDFVSTEAVLPLDTWTHVAVTKTAGAIKIYFNGELKDSYIGTLSNRTSTSKIRIGDDYRGGTTVSYKGYMNDWRLYDHCLSPLEVKEISQGLVLHYKLDTTKILDSSGYNRNGIIYGSLSSNTNTPHYSNSTYISSGDNNYIITPESIGNSNDAITANIWFRSTNILPGNSFHVCCSDLSNYAAFEMNVHSSGYFRSGLYINGSHKVANCGENLLDGSWHMLTITYDGTIIKRYIDGENYPDASQEATGVIDAANTCLIIGKVASTSYYCKEAYLSDMRIYSTALSEDDIKSLYNVKMRIDNLGVIHIFEINETINEKLIKTGTLQTNKIEEYNTKQAKLEKNDGWYASEFIEI